MAAGRTVGPQGDDRSGFPQAAHGHDPVGHVLVRHRAVHHCGAGRSDRLYLLLVQPGGVGEHSGGPQQPVVPQPHGRPDPVGLPVHLGVAAGRAEMGVPTGPVRPGQLRRRRQEILIGVDRIDRTGPHRHLRSGRPLPDACLRDFQLFLGAERKSGPGQPLALGERGERARRPPRHRPPQPHFFHGLRRRQRRGLIGAPVVMVQQGGRPRQSRLHRPQVDRRLALLRRDLGGVRPHEPAQPFPTRQTLAQGAPQRLEEVVVAVDEAGHHQQAPARYHPAGQETGGFLSGPDGGDPAAGHGRETALDDRPGGVEGDDRPALEQEVAARRRAGRRNGRAPRIHTGLRYQEIPHRIRS